MLAPGERATVGTGRRDRAAGRLRRPRRAAQRAWRRSTASPSSTARHDRRRIPRRDPGDAAQHGRAQVVYGFRRRPHRPAPRPVGHPGTLRAGGATARHRSRRGRIRIDRLPAEHKEECTRERPRHHQRRRPAASKSAPADRATAGPFDETEANAVRPYVDLGGVKILPRRASHLRLEVEEGSKRVVAVGLDYAGSTLQVHLSRRPVRAACGTRSASRSSSRSTSRAATPRSRGHLRPRGARRDPVAAGDGRRPRASPASSVSTGRAGSSAV